MINTPKDIEDSSSGSTPNRIYIPTVTHIFVILISITSVLFKELTKQKRVHLFEQRVFKQPCPVGVLSNSNRSYSDLLRDKNEIGNSEYVYRKLHAEHVVNTFCCYSDLKTKSRTLTFEHFFFFFKVISQFVSDS